MNNLLYKYLDINGAKMMLYHNTLMYANATTFNDPFDCHPCLIDFSKVPSERCIIWDATAIEDLESNRYINNRNDIWICCLSKVYDSLLMWSYYNKHAGVCIGLNMEQIKKYIHVGYGMMVTTQAREVKYTDIINKPDYYRNREDFFSYQVFTKAKAWEHEQEMRLYIFRPSPMFMALLPHQQDRNEFDWKEVRAFIKIGPECFDSIYLGVNISNTDRYRIIRLAKKINPEIKVYQMFPKTNSFNLIARLEEEI